MIALPLESLQFSSVIVIEAPLTAEVPFFTVISSAGTRSFKGVVTTSPGWKVTSAFPGPVPGLFDSQLPAQMLSGLVKGKIGVAVIEVTRSLFGLQ